MDPAEGRCAQGSAGQLGKCTKGSCEQDHYCMKQDNSAYC